jgi:hypothetical protein
VTSTPTPAPQGILATPTRDGRLLNAVFYARREQLLQELPPPLDGIEDDA